MFKSLVVDDNCIITDLSVSLKIRSDKKNLMILFFFSGAWSAPRKKVDGRYIVRHSYVTHTTKRTSLIPGQGINKSSTLPIVPSKPFF